MGWMQGITDMGFRHVIKSGEKNVRRRQVESEKKKNVLDSGRGYGTRSCLYGYRQHKSRLTGKEGP